MTHLARMLMEKMEHLKDLWESKQEYFFNTLKTPHKKVKPILE